MAPGTRAQGEIPIASQTTVLKESDQRREHETVLDYVAAIENENKQL